MSRRQPAEVQGLAERLDTVVSWIAPPVGGEEDRRPEGERWARFADRITPSELKHSDGMTSPETVRKWLSGAATPRASYLAAIAKELRVNLNWLLLGGDRSEREGEPAQEWEVAQAFRRAIVDRLVSEGAGTREEVEAVVKDYDKLFAIILGHCRDDVEQYHALTRFIPADQVVRALGERPTLPGTVSLGMPTTPSRIPPDAVPPNEGMLRKVPAAAGPIAMLASTQEK